ncbi:MAG: acetolactate synthase small subunit [Actinomycetota bacterium]|jgi:acetolactate synthase-1/3 small subunit
MSPEPFSGIASHEPTRHHILSVLVENKAGVLSRVAGLFSRRGFNIYSLAVAPSQDDHRFSRITIVVDAEDTPISQITAQLNKLINVVEIHDMTPGAAVERELLLATISSATMTEAEARELAASLGGEVVDVTTQGLSLMVAGTPSQVDSAEHALDSRGVRELHRTGRIALPRLSNLGAEG